MAEKEQQFPGQEQEPPGKEMEMDPAPQSEMKDYKAADKLKGAEFYLPGF